MARSSFKEMLHDLRANPRATLKALVGSWVTVSLVANLVATVFDLGLVIALVQLGHLQPPLAAPLGVALGATVNFTINKVVSFRDVRGHWASQLLRFFGGTAVAATIHMGLMYLLTTKLHVFYVISKLLADVMVFTVGNIVILRFLVFPESATDVELGKAPGGTAPTADPAKPAVTPLPGR